MNKATNLQGDEFVVMTREEYDALVADTYDGALIDAARAEADGQARMPQEFVMAVMEGEMHPLTAWRKSAGMTMEALASKAGVRKATVSDLESGKLDPRYCTISALAVALSVEPSDIMESHRPPTFSGVFAKRGVLIGAPPLFVKLSATSVFRPAEDNTLQYWIFSTDCHRFGVYRAVTAEGGKG